MHPDTARELKERILAVLRSRPTARHAGGTALPWVAVGLALADPGRARVAVRLGHPSDRALLPDLGAAASAEMELRVLGEVRALSSPGPGQLRRRVRPLRPGLSLAHPTVTAGTLGGFVRVGGRPAVVSNNHVLAASDAAELGDPVLQPGPFDGGRFADRVGSLTRFERFRSDAANLVDAAVAVLDDGVDVDAGDLPGGPLTGAVPAVADIDPGELVEKVGRTTGHTSGRISAVEVDGVAVRYEDPGEGSAGVVHTFDDQIEIEGLAGSFSAGGDSGSVIWRSSDRAPLGLLFAGSTEGGSAGGGLTFANPLSTVLSTLGAEWIAG